MKNKLWCDLTTDKERAEFIRSGRAVETGILAPAIADDVADAFEFRSVRTVSINLPEIDEEYKGPCINKNCEEYNEKRGGNCGQFNNLNLCCDYVQGPPEDGLVTVSAHGFKPPMFARQPEGVARVVDK